MLNLSRGVQKTSAFCPRGQCINTGLTFPVKTERPSSRPEYTQNTFFKFLGDEREYLKTLHNISTKKSRGTGLSVYMSHTMTGEHVTQPAFSCISFERLNAR